MKPHYWKTHQQKVARKIRERYDRELSQCFKDMIHCKQINEMIETYSTGSLEEMAKKLKISINTVMRLLIFMIDHLDCPITYDSLLRTYFYAADGELRIGFYPSGDLN